MKEWRGEIRVWNDGRVAPDGLYRMPLPKLLCTTEETSPELIEHIRECLHQGVNELCDDMQRLETDEKAECAS